MARELGPRGIHVAHVVIDEAINTAWIRENFPERASLKVSGVKGSQDRLDAAGRSDFCVFSFECRILPKSECGSVEMWKIRVWKCGRVTCYEVQARENRTCCFHSVAENLRTDKNFVGNFAS
jgi:hypothetical protein